MGFYKNIEIAAIKRILRILAVIKSKQIFLSFDEAKKFGSIRALDGISEKTMTEHYKLYEGYVKKANEILEKLGAVDHSTANQVYSDLRELKVELSFALGGVRNHEDVQRLASVGARSFLVGESLLRQDDLALATRRLLGTAPADAA